MRRISAWLHFGMLCMFLAIPPPASAGDRYALIISGASGGPQYAQRYQTLRRSLAATLRQKFGYADDHIIMLAEATEPGIRSATRDNVRAALGELRQRVAKDDVVLVFLAGHGTTLDGGDGKFNLVGPDLTGDQWAALIKPIAGRMVFVNTTGGSFPFLHRIAGRGRVVVTATNSVAQQFDTVFPEFFVKAFDDPSADLDKNGKVSVWEAFNYASAAVKAWFEERGQLATERPLLDDTGAGTGREAGAPGLDGALAQVTYLQSDAVIPLTADTELARLLKQRAELESALELLRASKSNVTPDQYEPELERLLLELARIDRLIRSRT
jgi:Caspase domain